jgi:hypothetical protein
MMHAFKISSLIFNNLEDAPVGGMNGQYSLGFCDIHVNVIMSQKQNKEREG